MGESWDWNERSLEWTTDLKADKTGWETNSMGIKYPIWYSTHNDHC
jgi:hypothetical protein